MLRISKKPSSPDEPTSCNDRIRSGQPRLAAVYADASAADTFVHADTTGDAWLTAQDLVLTLVSPAVPCLPITDVGDLSARGD